MFHRKLQLLATSTLLLALCAVSAEARTFSLDGSLADWTEADRLDVVPGTGVDGFRMYGYHDAGTGKYHVALEAEQAIGPGTTFWLNTDQDESTGYLVWGFLVGAEYNVNIAFDGTPHLYRGADGENWVTGPLSHAFSADRGVFEFEIEGALISADKPIALFADVNNAVFLPGWYGVGGYTVDAVGVPPAPAPPENGPITLDGELSDWSPKDRLDRLPGTRVLGYELYGRSDGDTYYVAVRALPPAAAPLAQTTLWLNTDRNRNTGYLVWGIAVGAEHNINFAADGKPHLYTGAAAESWQTGPLPHGRSGDGNIIEIAISKSLLAPEARSIDISMDVNNAVFVPADFTGPGYTLYHPEDLPARDPERSTRVGIVFSETSAAQFFGDKAYNQLYAAMQHQAMLAGLPMVLLSEDDLTDIHKLKDLDALFIPYFAHVPAEKVAVIEDTLIRAVHYYDIGIVSAGNFMTNEPDGSALPGDSYARMKRLFGITLQGYFGPADHTLQAEDGHAIVRPYAPGETLSSYTAGWMQHYTRHNSVATSVVRVNNGSGSWPAVWAVANAGRSVHFASPAVLGDTDLAWRALLWSVYGDDTWVGVQLTRQKSVFIGRCDMDQSQYADEVQALYPDLLKVIQSWRDKFSFVSSYYVNVGNNAKEGEYTNWDVSTPVYKSLMAMGNEIGTHSYTHPHDTPDLSDDELEFEFKASADVISKHIGVPVQSAAVPGNPETLAVDAVLDKHFTYATADFSGKGAGYHGAMGFLSPDFTMVYLAPNMFFDFTMIGFLNYTADEALLTWKTQYDDLTRHAPGAFVVWPWHDYGPTSYEGPQYTEAMFTGLIAYAYAQGAEFMTGLTAAKRVLSHANSALRVRKLDTDTLEVEVTGDAHTGAMALRLESQAGRVIASVDGWPAFSADKVLLGSGSRTYVVRLGKVAAEGAHLRALPMRAVLKSVTREGTSLSFALTGAGDVDIALPGNVLQVKSSCGEVLPTAQLGVVRVRLQSEGDHACKLSWAPEA